MGEHRSGPTTAHFGSVGRARREGGVTFRPREDPFFRFWYGFGETVCSACLVPVVVEGLVYAGIGPRMRFLRACPRVARAGSEVVVMSGSGLGVQAVWVPCAGCFQKAQGWVFAVAEPLLLYGVGPLSPVGGTHSARRARWSWCVNTITWNGSPLPSSIFSAASPRSSTKIVNTSSTTNGMVRPASA